MEKLEQLEMKLRDLQLKLGLRDHHQRVAAVLQLGLSVLEDTIGELASLGNSQRARKRAADLESFLQDLVRRHGPVTDLMSAAREEIDSLYELAAKPAAAVRP